jgi:hypothetical protein
LLISFRPPSSAPGLLANSCNSNVDGLDRAGVRVRANSQGAAVEGPNLRSGVHEHIQKYHAKVRRANELSGGCVHPVHEGLPARHISRELRAKKAGAACDGKPARR